MKTNAGPIPKPDSLLWGIYHTDREYARVMGDPLRTVIETRTKLAAEVAAASLGFGDALAHPVTAEQAKQAQWLPQHHPRSRLTRKPSRGIRV